MSMPRTLHCHAFGSDPQWQAICLDLDLAVQGRSFEEVFQLLNETIAFHLEGIAELPAADQTRLLNRRVPWLVRLRFALRAFYMAFSDHAGGPFEHRYTMPSPVPGVSA